MKTAAKDSTAHYSPPTPLAPPQPASPAGRLALYDAPFLQPLLPLSLSSCLPSAAQPRPHGRTSLPAPQPRLPRTTTATATRPLQAALLTLTARLTPGGQAATSPERGRLLSPRLSAASAADEGRGDVPLGWSRPAHEPGLAGGGAGNSSPFCPPSPGAGPSSPPPRPPAASLPAPG